MKTNTKHSPPKERIFSPHHLSRGLESSFYELISNSFDMLVLLDDTGNQFFVNESCREILGFEPEELVNINVIDQMIHPEDKERVRAAFLNVVNYRSHGGIQYRHKHKNGDWVYLEAVGNNLLNDPQLNAIVLNVRDVTDRVVAEQQLKENQKRLQELNAGKDKLMSIIAHDLRSPLNSILGFSELLLFELEDKKTEQAFEFTNAIHKSAHQMNELLGHLLLWARNQSGRLEFIPQEVSLNKIIEENIDFFKETALRKSIDISLSSSKTITVKADKNMLNTIFRNLISNGIKFTPNNGNIKIITKVQDQEVIVTVTDNGIGIPSQKIDNLFQIENSKSTKGTNGEKGTGLGLLLCKDFVEAHNGSIWVKNNSVKGTTFGFSLPLV